MNYISFAKQSKLSISNKFTKLQVKGFGFYNISR